MPDVYLVQRLDTLRSRLGAMRALGMTWREIAAEYPGVPAGTLCAIFKGRVPRKRGVLKALRLVGAEPWVPGVVRWLRGRERR